MDSTECVIDIIHSYEKLLNLFDKLKPWLINNDQKFGACVFLEKNAIFNQFNYNKAREIAWQYINQIKYLDNQKPKETFILPGLIAASNDTLALIRDINSAKDTFKKNMQILKKIMPRKDNKFLFDEAKYIRNQKITKILSNLHLSRLNLKQTYRHIPVLENNQLSKVTWTWAKTKAITKICIDELINRLKNKKITPAIEQQLQQAYELKRKNPQQHLAIIQNLTSHLRANILFTHCKNNKDTKSRIMTKGSLPIFYASNNNHNLPQFKIPITKKQAQMQMRKTRSDRIIQEPPLFPALRACLYVQNGLYT